MHERNRRRSIYAILAVVIVGGWVAWRIARSGLDGDLATPGGAPSAGERPGAALVDAAEREGVSATPDEPAPSAAPLHRIPELRPARGRGALLVTVERRFDGERVPEVGLTAVPLDDLGLLRAREAVTDEAGEARFEDLRPGPFRLLVDRAGSQVAEVAADGITRVVVQLSTGIQVFGLVVDEHREPVPGADVMIGEEILSDDHRGRGGRPASLAGVAFENLLPTRTSYATRPDGRTERPPPAAHGLRTRVVARSDASGRFSLAEVARGRYVCARKADHAPSALVPVTAAVGESETLELVLPGPGCGVVGTLLDPEGLPVAGALIEAGDPNAGVWHSLPGKGRLPPGRPQRVRSNEQGRFEALGLHPGEVWIRVQADGFGPAWESHELGPRERRETTIVLTRGCTVRGRVIDAAGDALPGALVQAHEFGPAMPRGCVRADHLGEFSLRGVRPLGVNRTVLIAADAGDLGLGSTLARGAQEGEELEVVITVEAGLTLMGRVVTESGAPLIGYRVRAHTTGGVRDWHDLASEDIGRFTIRGRTITDGDGSFTIPCCLDQEYSLLAQPPGEAGSWLVAFAREARPGPEELVLMVPRRRLPTARIHARVTGPAAAVKELTHVTLAITSDVYGRTSQLYDSLPIARDGSIVGGPMPSGRGHLRFMAGEVERARVEFELAPDQMLDLGDVTVD